MTNPIKRRDFIKLGSASVLITSASADSLMSLNPPITTSSLSFVVIFEVKPTKEGYQEYLNIAKNLRPMLESVEGFLSVQRFTSRTRDGWILSLSYWSDEAALVSWRTNERHHDAQDKGRGGIFSDYRLRVAQVITDNDLISAERRPLRQSAYNDPDKRKFLYVGLLEVAIANASEAEGVDLAPVIGASLTGLHGHLGNDVFDSLSTKGRFIHLVSWQNEKAAFDWQRQVLAYLKSTTIKNGPKTSFRLRLAEIERDYGMFDRTQAPQYFPEAKSQKQSR